MDVGITCGDLGFWGVGGCWGGGAVVQVQVEHVGEEEGGGG